MAIDLNLIKQFEDALNEMDDFRNSFKKMGYYHDENHKLHTIIIDPRYQKSEYNELLRKDEIINIPPLKPYVAGPYPLINVYRFAWPLSNSTFIPTFLSEKDAIKANFLKEEEFEHINEKFKVIRKKLNKFALELREQIIFTPLPEEPLDDLQKVVLQLDPYCTKLKEKLKNIADLMEDPENKAPWGVEKYDDEEGTIEWVSTIPYWKKREIENPPRTKYDYQKINHCKPKSDLERFKETI